MIPRLPAEWAPQSGVQLTWPTPLGHWETRTPDAERVLARIAREISLRQRVVIACMDEAHVTQRLHEGGVNMGMVSLYPAPANDVWARDHAPLTILDENDRPTLLDFTFNGWGGKHPADLDNAVTRTLHAAGAFGATEMETLPLVLEGGAIETDGAGTLLTTASCLPGERRNPGMRRDVFEAYLHEYLRVRHVLWLEHGWIAGDDTDGHIDTLARFVDPLTIAYVTCENPEEPHYDALRQMERALEELRNSDGLPYRLVPLPLPAPVRDETGQQLPATYANFLIINDAVLAPVYGDANDELALGRIQDCFPERAIIGIDCRDIIRQHGSLHCLAMQYPAGVIPEEPRK